MTPSATTPARILIVDDDARVRELVRRLLERAGYDCATAENGALGFALILFRNNSTGSSEYGNLTVSGSGVTLDVRVASGAPAGIHFSVPNS